MSLVLKRAVSQFSLMGRENLTERTYPVVTSIHRGYAPKLIMNA